MDTNKTNSKFIRGSCISSIFPPAIVSKWVSLWWFWTEQTFLISGAKLFTCFWADNNTDFRVRPSSWFVQCSRWKVWQRKMGPKPKARTIGPDSWYIPQCWEFGDQSCTDDERADDQLLFLVWLGGSEAHTPLLLDSRVIFHSRKWKSSYTEGGHSVLVRPIVAAKRIEFYFTPHVPCQSQLWEWPQYILLVIFFCPLA